MAITVVTNPNQSIDDSPKHFYGLAGDTKPTIASHPGVPQPTIGSTFYETDTLLLYITYNGTNWVKDALSIALTPAIYNVTMTSADTEYSQALPTNTKKFLIHTRDGTTFRLAFVTGKVAMPTAPYFTVLANDIYYEDDIKATPTLYFGCASAGKVIEIIAWS